MTHLGQLNTSNFFCICKMTSPDTVHTCVKSEPEVNRYPLVRMVVLGVLGVVAFVIGILAVKR